MTHKEYISAELDRIIDSTGSLEMSRYGAQLQITAPNGTKTKCITITLSELKKIKTVLANRKEKP